MYHNCSAPGPLACGVPYTCCITNNVSVISIHWASEKASKLVQMKGRTSHWSWQSRSPNFSLVLYWPHARCYFVEVFWWIQFSCYITSYPSLCDFYFKRAHVNAFIFFTCLKVVHNNKHVTCQGKWGFRRQSIIKVICVLRQWLCLFCIREMDSFLPYCILFNGTDVSSADVVSASMQALYASALTPDGSRSRILLFQILSYLSELLIIFCLTCSPGFD